MSAEIQAVTIGTQESRLILSAGSAARILSIGSSWTKLRIGLRIAMGDSGGNIGGTPRFQVGVLSNPTANLSNGPLTNACSNFWGVSSDDASWTREAGPGYVLPAAVRAATKVGASLTIGSGSGAGQIRMSATPGTIRNALVLLLDKGTNGNADWNIGAVYRGGLTTGDIPYAALELAMEASHDVASLAQRCTDIKQILNSYAGSPTEYVGGNGANLSGATVNEALNGALNSICISWSLSAVPIYISEILFVKSA